MKQYFTKQFLFDINRVMLEPVDKAFLTVGVVLLVLAAVMKLAAKFAPTPVDAKYRNKFFIVLLTIGFSEIAWFGLRYQYAQFLGSHFVAMAILVVGLVWFGYILKNMVRSYGSEKEIWDKEQVKLKYLPK